MNPNLIDELEAMYPEDSEVWAKIRRDAERLQRMQRLGMLGGPTTWGDLFMAKAAAPAPEPTPSLQLTVPPEPTDLEPDRCVAIASWNKKRCRRGKHPGLATCMYHHRRTRPSPEQQTLQLGKRSALSQLPRRNGRKMWPGRDQNRRTQFALALIELAEKKNGKGLHLPTAARRLNVSQHTAVSLAKEAGLVLRGNARGARWYLTGHAPALPNGSAVHEEVTAGGAE